MKIMYEINENSKEEIILLLRREKNLVVKERLIIVSLFMHGMLKKDIANCLGKGSDTVGKWISAYFKGGISLLGDGRGGDHKSYLSHSQKEEVRHIIMNSYPLENKKWDGKLIQNLIKLNYGVTYTITGVYALLKNLKINYKI